MNNVPSDLNSQTGQVVVQVSVRLSEELSHEEKTADVSFQEPTILAEGAGSLFLLQLMTRTANRNRPTIDLRFIVRGLISIAKEADEWSFINDLGRLAR